jgi:hypothetical protein
MITNQSSTRFGDDSLPLLEYLCESCNGNGGDFSGVHWVRCAKCCGVGYVATEFGQQVLTLMRHNFRSLTEE